MIDLKITVSESNSDDNRVSQITSTLVEMLRDFNLEYINNSQKDDKQPFTKGDTMTVGAIILGVVSVALPSIISFLQHWAIDRRKIIIETPNGYKLEFSSEKKYTEEELLAFVDKLDKRV